MALAACDPHGSWIEWLTLESESSSQHGGAFRRWRLFQRHLAVHYRVALPDEQIYRRAERFVFVHPLRALDAMHLASALRSAEEIGIAVDFRFGTANRVQVQAAAAEGLTVYFIS